MQVTVKYSVITSTDTIYQTLTKKFKIVIVASDIEVVMKTNLPGAIFDLANQTNLILNSTES